MALTLCILYITSMGQVLGGTSSEDLLVVLDTQFRSRIISELPDDLTEMSIDWLFDNAAGIALEVYSPYSDDLSELAESYENELMSGMQRQANRKQHTNVLQHIQGYFSKQLSADDRAEITQVIEEYRQGLVPLVAPLTLIRHHLRHHPDSWILSQTYLEPYPRQLFSR